MEENSGLILAHSGGTNEYGCHSGSEPYHCHNELEPDINWANVCWITSCLSDSEVYDDYDDYGYEESYDSYTNEPYLTDEQKVGVIGVVVILLVAIASMF